MKNTALLQVKTVICLITISLFSIKSYSQYCTPAPIFGCFTGDYPSQFSMTGTSSSINDPSLTCAIGAGGFGGYEDRTAETCAVASPSIVNCTITSNTQSTYSTYTTFTSPSGMSTRHTPVTESCQIWVDWDNSGVFGDQPNESIGGMEPLPNSSVPFTATIPSGIATGYYRMRLVVSSGTTYPNMDPCISGFSFTGDAIDYIIYVGPTCTAPTVTLGAATCTSQTINWGAVSGASGYEYVVNTSSTAPAGSGAATTATTYNATGLTAGTTYYAWVRTNCGGGSFSSWVSRSFIVGPSAITGSGSVCTGATTQLSDAASGGVWSSSNTAVATISNTGLVHGGTTPGTTTITYSVGGCSTTLLVTVGSLPPIIGSTTLCPNSTTQLSDATSGGFWGSSNTSVATIGQTTGIAYSTATAGTTTIVYGLSASCTATVTLTVSTLPAIISDGSSVCVGQTTQLSDATSGGVWTSSSTPTASVSSTGVVTGGAVGSVTITYTTGSCYVTKALTVGNAITSITGASNFCVTSSTALSDATSGGTWTSSNNSVATILSAGVVVHGVTAGTVNITYTLGGCYVTKAVTVDPNNGGTITGKDSVCKGAGHAITLSDAATGGVWSSGTTSRATVDPATGVVTAASYGPSTVNINYVVTNTCGTYTATYVVHLRTSSQCATGVNPVISQEAGLKVFPNPNDGTFTMNLSSDIDEEVRVVMTNLVGEKVKEFTTATNKMFDVKVNVAAGIYLLTASTNHGKYVAKVVIDK